MAFYTDGVVPWNSLDDNTRAPLASELENGYPCGEADQQLFNWTAGWSIGNIWNMILQSGITPDTDKLLDLARAIQSGKVNYAVATGSANALTVSLSPAPTLLSIGLVVNVLISSTNTSAATINVNGLGAKSIQYNGVALLGGELLSGSIQSFIFDGTNFQLFGGVASGKMLAIQVFDTVGTSTYTPTGGTKKIRVTVVGGGGAGGGCPISGASTFGGAAGGGAGGVARSYISSPGVQTVTVGAGGPANSGASGGAGGTSSFGSLLSATGGGGGAYCPPLSTSQVQLGGTSGVGTGGNLFNGAGAPGGPSVVMTSTNIVTGVGGASFLGGGGAAISSNGGDGPSSQSYGGGGAGGAVNNSWPAVSGGSGKRGIVIVEEFS